jgi:hypothetical protein
MAVRWETKVVGRVDREDTAPAPTAAGGYSAPGVHSRVALPCLGRDFPVRLRVSRDDKKCNFMTKAEAAASFRHFR